MQIACSPFKSHTRTGCLYKESKASPPHTYLLPLNQRPFPHGPLAPSPGRPGDVQLCLVGFLSCDLSQNSGMLSRKTFVLLDQMKISPF